MKFYLKEVKYIRNDSILSNYISTKADEDITTGLIKGLSNIAKLNDGIEISSFVDVFSLDNSNYDYVIVSIENYGLFMIRRDNIKSASEITDPLNSRGFKKILHNGNKTILVTEAGKRFVTTRNPDDRPDIEKAVMMVLLKSQGFTVKEIYDLIEIAKNTKQ